MERLVLAPPLYERLADTATPQDPYVLVAPPRRLGAFPTEQTPGGSGTLSELPPGVTRLVVADVIQDPGNLGTILRSARAFGFDFAVATLGTAGIASPKVLRASAGALFRMTIVSGVSPGEIVEWLARRGFLVVILDPHGPVSLAEVQWREPLAIVIGNEAQGPSDEWEKGSGNAGGGPESSRSTASGRPKTRSEFMRVCIPMSPGSESLNTAAAAAIAFHSVSRALFPFH